MLGSLLGTMVKHGRLTIMRTSEADTFGSGEPRITVKLHDRRAIWQLAMNPDLQLGALYMEGRLTVRGGAIAR